MKLLFHLEDQVHTFSVNEEVNGADLLLLKESLFRFFESHPSYTILDLSHAHLKASPAALDKTLIEINTFAQALGLNLIIARTAEESANGKQLVLERALLKQVEILQAKVELREKMRFQAERLVAENSKLKDSMNEQLEKLRTLQKDESPLSPLLEKLWSEK